MRMPDRAETSSVRRHSARLDVLIVSWGGGGNLPPLLAAGKLLAARDPNTAVAFEQQAAQLMAAAAGPAIALDVRDLVAELRPALMIVDCMLPAGIAAGESTGTPTVSLVHFPYGLARTQMLRGAGAWTTDRARSTAPAAASAWSPRETTSLPGNQPSCS